MRGRRALRRIGIAAGVALLLCAVAAGGFVAWAQNSFPAEPAPLADAERTPGVRVDIGSRATVVAPTDAPARVGVVFYPGARVEPEAYAAVWAPIVARSGVRVVIPDMPLNLALFGRGRAGELIDGDDTVERWYVGGHSMGGAMAAFYAGGEPRGSLAGVILWGSYATEGAGLAQREDLRVLSVSGGRDGLSDPADTEANRPHLPADATTRTISGMNHAQFGAYGPQPGDGASEISDAEAHRALGDVVADFLTEPVGTDG
ncbi:alpha/beta hydrolase [Nocardiopsis sp. NPDC049922]|uniref:alpha/beta hydrolase n=1 Tax=Nocardiopsis sp. NPDC049922 TaxID=3155157 RepID=UPI00340125A1